MTLTQSSAAPHRQQRFIELRNNGSVNVPPFGVAEIMGSYRPETGGYTPNDGRTVMEVRRATTDSPCATIVNFACEIPVGEERRVGSMDSPLLALVADLGYPTGTVVGVRKNSFVLEKGYCGWIILGDPDPITGTMRVARYDNCGAGSLMVRAYECVKPGDEDKLAIPQKWNPISKCYEDDADKTWVKICDCNKWLLALPGECFKVERDDQCGQENDGCWRPAFPYGLTRRVKITSEISPGACGEATIMKGNDGCLGTASECTIQVCNPTKRRVGCDADEYATFHAVPGECGGPAPICYGWIVPDPRPLRATAVLTADLCSDNASFRNVVYMDVCGWTPREEPTTGGNPIPRKACANKNCELTWNDCECQWDVLTVEGVPVKPVLDISCPTTPCDPIQRTRPKTFMYVEQCEQCGDTELDATGMTGTQVDLVTGLASAGGETGVSVFTSVACDGECTISFGTSALTSAGLTLQKKRYCLYCSAPEDLDDTPLANFATLGAAGAAATLVGTRVTVVTGMEPGTGGASVSAMSGIGIDDGTEGSPKCEITTSGVTLTANGYKLNRKSYCMFCASEQSESDVEIDSNVGIGDPTPGSPIPLAGVELASFVDFTCNPCPKLEWDKRMVYVLCAGAEQASGYPAGECECGPCEPTGGASATNSGSPTPTPTVSQSATPSPSATASATISASPSNTPSRTDSATPSATGA